MSKVPEKIPRSFRAVKEQVEKNREEIINWLVKLIRFQSENKPPGGNEASAQEFIISEYNDIGLSLDSFLPDDIPGIEKHPSWLAGREYEKGRKNVVGIWKGQGRGKSVLLSGHIDVAPKEPNVWTECAPFEPVLKKDRLYGRGACDMKGGLTAMFWAVKILKQMGYSPEGDIIIESLVDEEYAGGNGTLAARLSGYNADFAILSEPSRMEIAPASMGAFLGDCTITGKAGMPYMGKDIPNPAIAAGNIINRFKEWQAIWRESNHHPLFETPDKQLNVIIWNIKTAKPGEFIQMGIPLFTTISWIVFCYPRMTEDRFYSKFKEFWSHVKQKDEMLANLDLIITPTYHFIRPWETDRDSYSVQTLREVYEEYTGKNPLIGGAPFSCDLAVYGVEGGMESVILGPRGGNLHAPDEWVLIEDVLTLAGLYASFIITWCG